MKSRIKKKKNPVRISKRTRDPQAKDTGGLRRKPGERRQERTGLARAYGSCQLRGNCVASAHQVPRKTVFRTLPGPLSKVLVSGTPTVQ